jgi:hypothetical protein
MYKLQLTEKQATALVELLISHGEWVDVLDPQDRELFAIIHQASQDLAPVFEYVERETKRKREEEHARHLEANKKAAN